MNPLYRYPAQANAVKNGALSGKARRRALRTLRDHVCNLEHRSYDEYSARANRRMKLLEQIMFLLGILLGFSGISSLISENRSFRLTAAAILAAVMLADFALFGIWLIMRRRLLRHFLEQYEPVCTDRDEASLTRAGAMLCSCEPEAAFGKEYRCLTCGGALRGDGQPAHCPKCSGNLLVPLGLYREESADITAYWRAVREQGGC